MREYVREMAFDFYPEADGLFIESSDYAICHCAECGRGSSTRVRLRPCHFRRVLGAPARRDRGGVSALFLRREAALRLHRGRGGQASLRPALDALLHAHSAALEPALIARPAARGGGTRHRAVSTSPTSEPVRRKPARRSAAAMCRRWSATATWCRRPSSASRGWSADDRFLRLRLAPRRHESVSRTAGACHSVGLSRAERQPGLAGPGTARAPGPRTLRPRVQSAQVEDLLFLFQVFNTDRDWSVPGALTTAWFGPEPRGARTTRCQETDPAPRAVGTSAYDRRTAPRRKR